MPSYEDAPESLILHWDSRRVPMLGLPNGGLPDLLVDLDDLAARIVTAPPPETPQPTGRAERKVYDLRTELAGQSELAFVNALCIAHLRKRSWPDDAPFLFRRLWTECSDRLLEELPLRWLISSVITFSTHGETEAERRLGQSLNVLFSLVKLYEYERTYSSHAPQEPFRAHFRKRPPMPMGLPTFALLNGKLDIEFLAPIWYEAETTPVLGPLACHLLRLMNEDEGTLFRRLTRMRAEAKALRRARNAARGDAEDAGDGDEDDAP